MTRCPLTLEQVDDLIVALRYARDVMARSVPPHTCTIVSAGPLVDIVIHSGADDTETRVLRRASPPPFSRH